MAALSLAKPIFFFHRSLLQNIFFIFELVENHFWPNSWDTGGSASSDSHLSHLVCVQPSAQGNPKTFFCSPIDEIQQEIKEQKDVERHMKNMSNDLIKLNTLITKNNSSVEELQNGRLVTESEFLQSLKVLGTSFPDLSLPCRSEANSDPGKPSLPDNTLLFWFFSKSRKQKKNLWSCRRGTVN